MTFTLQFYDCLLTISGETAFPMDPFLYRKRFSPQVTRRPFDFEHWHSRRKTKSKRCRTLFCAKFRSHARFNGATRPKAYLSSLGKNVLSKLEDISNMYSVKVLETFICKPLFLLKRCILRRRGCSRSASWQSVACTYRYVYMGVVVGKKYFCEAPSTFPRTKTKEKITFIIHTYTYTIYPGA